MKGQIVEKALDAWGPQLRLHPLCGAKASRSRLGALERTKIPVWARTYAIPPARPENG